MGQLRFDLALAGESHLEGDSRARQFHDQSFQHPLILVLLLLSLSQVAHRQAPHGLHLLTVEGQQAVTQELEL